MNNDASERHETDSSVFAAGDLTRLVRSGVSSRAAAGFSAVSDSGEVDSVRDDGCGTAATDDSRVKFRRDSRVEFRGNGERRPGRNSLER